MKDWIKKPWTVFIVGAVIATVAELVGSYIMDMAVGGYTWNYNGYFLNFKGRVALVPSLMFGLLICLAVCLLHPAIIRLQDKYKNNRIHNTLFIVVFALFIVDLICRIWLGPNFKG